MKIVPLEQPIQAVVDIPGSKSYTNRALVMAAMTKNTVTIHNPLNSDDIDAMVDCLTTLGIKVERTENEIKVIGSVEDVKDQEYILNARLSGTTIRFILALCCIVPGVKALRGEEHLNKRPIGELVEGLRQLGAEIEYLGEEGFPPLKIKSSHLNPGTTKLNGDISSQYFSALLMIAPLVGELNVEVIGDQISKPYIDMTIDTMEKFGVKVENLNYQSYVIKDSQSYSIHEYTVEGDFSAAGYFLAIATLTESEITLKNLNPNSKQADREFLDILMEMGTEVEKHSDGITVKGHGVKSLTVNMEGCPDQVQTLAVLAAFADGVTKIDGVRSLRVKETERVKALETELAKMGIKTESTHDTLTIYGGTPKPATIDTYHDHRMAMAFAVAGTKLNGMEINNPEVVSKTFPEFWKKLEQVCH